MLVSPSFNHFPTPIYVSKFRSDRNCRVKLGTLTAILMASVSSLKKNKKANPNFNACLIRLTPKLKCGGANMKQKEHLELRNWRTPSKLARYLSRMVLISFVFTNFDLYSQKDLFTSFNLCHL